MDESGGGNEETKNKKGDNANNNDNDEETKEWTADEFTKLLELVKEYGKSNFKRVAEALGTNRKPKECSNKYKVFLEGLKQKKQKGFSFFFCFCVCVFHTLNFRNCVKTNNYLQNRNSHAKHCL